MKYLPDRKVLAGGVAAVGAWAIALAAARYGYPIDPSLMPGLVILIGYAISYFVPPSQQDILKRLNDELVKLAQDDPNIPVTKPVVTTQGISNGK